MSRDANMFVVGMKEDEKERTPLGDRKAALYFHRGVYSSTYFSTSANKWRRDKSNARQQREAAHQTRARGGRNRGWNGFFIQLQFYRDLTCVIDRHFTNNQSLLWLNATAGCRLVDAVVTHNNITAAATGGVYTASNYNVNAVVRRRQRVIYVIHSDGEFLDFVPMSTIASNYAVVAGLSRFLRGPHLNWPNDVNTARAFCCDANNFRRHAGPTKEGIRRINAIATCYTLFEEILRRRRSLAYTTTLSSLWEFLSHLSAPRVLLLKHEVERSGGRDRHADWNPATSLQRGKSMSIAPVRVDAAAWSLPPALVAFCWCSPGCCTAAYMENINKSSRSHGPHVRGPPLLKHERMESDAAAFAPTREFITLVHSSWPAISVMLPLQDQYQLVVVLYNVCYTN
ncbi:hypothetical protein B566_EDAN014558 [Ephemera danica]|nr:hypothetical protein B566_EDAN014558 [Ephemera danica]